MIAAVLFDLDDTLYLQEEWLNGAFDAVAAAAATSIGADAVLLRRALAAVAAEGSDKGHIIDRALARCGYPVRDVPHLVNTFLTHAPPRLTPLPGVVAGLPELRRHVPIGLVTDGEPGAQRAKVRALGLAQSFDAVVISDELGREHRKPDPAPFCAALSVLGIGPADAVYVGDRPDKDVAGAHRAGMRAIRVRTGEHSGLADDPSTWLVVDDVAEAISLLASRLAPAPPAGGQ